jgi:hypothetical protein
MGFRFPALVSPFRSVNENDSEGCLSAKGCGGGLSPFWGSFIAAAIVSQSGSHFYPQGTNYGLYCCLSKKTSYLCLFH